MAKEPTTGNSTSFFKVDADGYIYLRSATPKEGYVEYFNRENKSAGYKKIYSATDDGQIAFLGIHVAEFDTGKVEYVSITIKSEDGYENVQFPLKTQKGKLSAYAKSIAQVLPNVDFTQNYSISFDKRKDDNGYSIKNIYLNQSDVEDTPAVPVYHKYLNRDGDNGGDIPQMEQKEGLSGVEWDTMKQDKFLFNSLMEQIERFKAFKAGHSEAAGEKTSAKPKAEKKEEPIAKSTTKTSLKRVSPQEAFADKDEDDDLPF